MTEPQVENLRRIVDEVLLAGHDRVQSLVNAVIATARERGIPWDGRTFMEYWSDLMRMGVVAVPGDYVVTINGGTLPRLHLTERGTRLLKRGEESPHNTSRYLSALKRRVSNSDEVAMSFLAEAVEAWRCGLNRSSAVMLGCACERLVLLLAEAIAANDSLPGTAKVRKVLDGRVFISQLFDAIRSTLTQLRGEGKLPRDLGNGLDRKLSAIFDHARGLRNDCGHPTGEPVTAEDAEAGLLLFPGFYELARNLGAAMASQPG